MKAKTSLKLVALTLFIAMIIAGSEMVANVSQPDTNQNFGKLPLTFEKNSGQTDSRVKYISRGPGYTMFLTQKDVLIKLRPAGENSREEVVTLKIVGAENNARISGVNELSARANYLRGKDRSQWITDVSTYEKVKYENIYPGIDVVYYGKQQELEYDFVVAPGIDPNQIAMTFEGARKVSANQKGELEITTAQGTVTQQPPFIYQEVDGQRKEIPGRYVIKNQKVSFAIGAYDRSKTLVIDPILLYSSYIGGSSYEGVNSLALTSTAQMVLAGDTASLDFPTASALQPAFQGVTDAFVMKFKAGGRILDYSTYIGGSSRDRAFSVATAADGSVFLTGETLSSDFPVTASAYQTTIGGGADVFLLKLSSKGKSIEYSTYLGGSGSDIGLSVVNIDGDSVVLSGRTGSVNFPTQSAIQPTMGGYYDALVARINTAQSGAASLTYSTYLGGSDWDEGLRVDVDGAGNAYVVGDTASEDFPTTVGAFQETFQTYPSDVFVTKIAADGSALAYSTYIGSPLLAGDDPLDVWKEEEGWAIAVDDVGHAHITGFTDSGDFPVTAGAYNSPSVASPGKDDVFVIKLALDGSSMIYGAMIGGSNLEKGAGIALDSSGSPYITGWTTSTDLPLLNQFQSTLYVSPAAYITKLTPDGSALVYSTYFGGYTTGGTRAWNIVVDSCENAYIGGETSSYNLPQSWDSFQPTYGGGYRDGFVSKFEGTPNCAPQGL